MSDYTKQVAALVTVQQKDMLRGLARRHRCSLMQMIRYLIETEWKYPQGLALKKIYELEAENEELRQRVAELLAD